MKRLHHSNGALAVAFLAPAILAIAFSSTPANAQIASSLLNETDPIPGVGPGHVITGLNNTAVNHAGGYAVSLNSSDGTTTLSSVWGHAAGGPGAVIRVEGTFGSLVQTSYESFYGMSNAGQIAYSASGTGGPVGGFDSVWLDDTPVMVEGDPYPHAANTWWRFGSRPGVTADGNPYFVGGLTYTQGGSTEAYGLFYGMTGAPVHVTGDLLPGLPAPLSTSSAISFDYRYSELGNHHIAEVDIDTGSTTDDGAMTLDGAGLMVGGSLVQEASPVPASVGGLAGENWDNFDYTGVNEAGDWFFTGDTDAATTSDEIVVRNGMIVLREGDVVDGETVEASIEGGYMNADGDLALIWDIVDGTSNIEALLFEDQVILREGDVVDFDGDGGLDPGAVIANFTGTSALTVSDRDFTGNVNIYFTADIDTAGTSSTSDDIEGFYCVTVTTGPVPVRVSGLAAMPLLREPAVAVTWQTSIEVEHAGFHVYRAASASGPWNRLDDELVTGRHDYRWVDGTVRGGMTYYYRIGAVDLAGTEVFYGPVMATTPTWGRVAELFGSAPNPFVDRTRVRFSMAREARATLSVFDVAGRRITTLIDGVLPAGEHDAWWDGRTEDGRLGAGGIYFYRLTTPDGTSTEKVVRLLQN
jgi:hypothetical protein